MTNVRDLLLTFISQEAFLILYLAYGLLLSKGWTLWGPSPKQQETGDGYWSVLITLPNGLKLSHWQTLRIWMPKGLCGRTLPLGLGSLIPSSWTTDSKDFRRYYCELGIKNGYSTLVYPQGSRQAETINKVIVNGLKKRLDDAKGKWMDELPHVLWTYQTASRRSTRKTPFSMTYGAEAVIPLEIGFLKLRTSLFAPDNNDHLLEKSLDLIEKRRENYMIQLAYY